MNLNFLTDKQTGYPSIDKPWLRYYKGEFPFIPNPNCSIYEYLHLRNENRLKYSAINYFGKKITYRELFDNIEKTVLALNALGVKKGDIVSVCPLNTPEFIYLLYAINKIGAVSNWIGITSSVEDLHNQLTSTDSRLVFTVNLAYDKIFEASKDSKVERVVVIPIEQSMPAYMKVVLSLKNKGKCSQGYYWKDFIRNTSSNDTAFEFYGEELAVIEYTGGSTGVPKGVMLSNKALNSHYVDFHITNEAGIFDFNESDRIISAVPLFLAFGLLACCHSPLCHGMELILSPDPSPSAGAKLIGKYKINHVMGGRLHVEELLNEARKSKWNLSYIKSIMYGGEETNKVWENEIRDGLKKLALNAPILNSYGMSETSAGVLTAPNDETDGLIPCAGVDVKIVNPDDCSEEYGYDKEGELCISTEQIMLGYFNYSIDTQDTYINDDGARWLKTHDLAVISTDGIIKITGRIKRIYSRLANDNIQIRVYPMRIEENLIKNEFVHSCAVVGIKDEILAYRTIAYIILSNKNINIEDAKEQLIIYCKKNLPDSHWPDEYVFVDSFPVTRSGKVDYRMLEKSLMKESNYNNKERSID